MGYIYSNGVGMDDANNCSSSVIAVCEHNGPTKEDETIYKVKMM